MVVVKHTAVDATDCCQALPVIQGKLDACNMKVTLHVGDAGYRLEGAVGGKMGVCVPEGTPLTGQQCLSGESLTIKMTKVCVHLYNCCGVNRKGRIRAVPKNQMDRAERFPPDDMLCTVSDMLAHEKRTTNDASYLCPCLWLCNKAVSNYDRLPLTV